MMEGKISEFLVEWYNLIKPTDVDFSVGNVYCNLFELFDYLVYRRRVEIVFLQEILRRIVQEAREKFSENFT